MAKLSARERANLPDRAFAYVDAAGKRRLPIHDEAHVRNALARFDRVTFPDDLSRDRARRRLLNAAKRYGIVPVGFITGQLRAERGDLSSLPTGAVTFLLVDIEGSTALLRTLGDDYAHLLRDVRGVIRQAVRKAGGHKVDAHGDEYFAVFERAASAVEAAVAIHRALDEKPWPGHAVVRVRAGIHSGRPALGETGYVGLSVHTVARVCSVAHGGQTVVTARAKVSMAEEMPADMRWRSLGRHHLAGLPKAEHLFQIDAEGLRTRFPPIRTGAGER